MLFSCYVCVELHCRTYCVLLSGVMFTVTHVAFCFQVCLLSGVVCCFPVRCIFLLGVMLTVRYVVSLSDVLFLY